MDHTQCILHTEDSSLKQSTEWQDGEGQDNSEKLRFPETVSLDPRGDLKLRNGTFLFLVSSNVLMLSSRYFEKMLQKDKFAEGLAQPQGENPPTKMLADEDPASFGTMCKLLHFQEVSPPESVKELSNLADVCDYYGTERAISVHIRAWIHPFEQPQCQLSIEELQKLLLVAYTFHLEHSFETFSVRLATMLDLKSVKALDLGRLPGTVQGESCSIFLNAPPQPPDLTNSPYVSATSRYPTIHPLPG